MDKLFLNKSEASHHLHSLYDAYIEKHSINDTSPDFHSLLVENLRNPASGSALKSGRQRGNNRKYGKIDFIRTGSGRPLFSRTTLDAWFNDVYISVMMKDLELASLRIDKLLGTRYLIRAA